MFSMYNLISGALGLVAIYLSYMAALTSGSALMAIFTIWRALAPKGRGSDALGVLPMFIPAGFWTALAIFAWVAVFAFYRQKKVRRE